MKKQNWTIESIDNLKGKIVIITGGASGIGLEAAKVLSSKGAQVIIAVRNIEKGQRALARIKADNPLAEISLMNLDLGNLASVRAFAQEFTQKYSSLDLLINNAGVMIPPYQKTEDGFELQFGTNHLGHFALTGLLMPLLTSTPGSRVVTVSSIASRGAKIYFDNLDGSKGFSTMNFYRQSKFSNLLFGKELDSKLKQSGSNTKSIVCHPGVSATNLFMRGSGKEGGKVMNFLVSLFAQPAHKGALPTLFAATNPQLQGGEYIGPDGIANFRGNPVISSEGDKLFKSDISQKLWQVSEQLTGVSF
ncbi:MAG: oxidoreductase [Bacteroidales bacterium]|jgi:NAD(P)-dependent dehydrogenase (short-subunit alcohol dehydrogenase family)|nr:oxidoreductase [Bacteroidales bacterium]